VKLSTHLNKLQTNDERMHKPTRNSSPQKLIATMGKNNQDFSLGIKKAYHTHLGGYETKELNHLMSIDKQLKQQLFTIDHEK
jgi:hypothetical protein